MNNLITPHGGTLCNHIANENKIAELKESAIGLKSLTLNERQLCDIELLMNGAFSPLKGYMLQEDYHSVIENMRLNDGTVWPMPVTLDVSGDFAGTLEKGEKITLRDMEGLLLAIMDVEDIWEPNLKDEAVKVFGSEDPKHPAVDYLFNRSQKVYLGGKLKGG